MSKKTRARTRTPKQPPPKRQLPWIWITAGAALLLIVGGLSLAWGSSPTVSPDPAFTPEVSGSPALEIDQAVVNEGDVKLNTMVRTSYTLRNVGDEPLQILGEPQVELVEGC